MYTSKGTAILDDLKRYGIVENDASLDLLKRKNMGGDLGDALDEALEDAKEFVEELTALVRRFNDLHASLSCTPDMAIKPADFAEFKAEEMKQVHQYNALVDKGVANDLDPYELDKMFVLIEQLGL